ncbi:MAG: hypothetical protein AAF944_00435 [Bacteroidota bacterium]
MKSIKIYLLLAAATIFAFSSCEEFEDDRLDFSDSQVQFVQLSSGSAITAAPTDTVSVEIEVRENLYTDINVNYEITGGITQSGTATIPNGELDITVDVILPATAGTATFTLTGVDNGLQVGRPNTSAAASAVTRSITWE